VDRLSLEASETKPLDFFSLVVWLVLNDLRRPARALDRPLKPRAEIILVRTRGPNSAHVGLDPKSGLMADVAGRQRCAITGSPRFSFDQLVGAGEQRLRHVEAECFSGLQVDDQLILGRDLHRQVGRPPPFRMRSI
jgi:hypothetical protein